MKQESQYKVISSETELQMFTLLKSDEIEENIFDNNYIVAILHYYIGPSISASEPVGFYDADFNDEQKIGSVRRFFMGLNFSEEKKLEHQLFIKSREQMRIEGVEEVMGFDDVSVRLKSSEGEMYIEGRDIKIDTLDTEKGVVALSGRINGVYYANDTGKEKKGFFGGLFR